MNSEALSLFFECFDTDEKEAEIIIGHAEKHGKIHIQHQDGEAAGMICTTEIADGDFSADYVFAVCTKPKFRSRGLFRKHLEEVIGNKPAVLIPETYELSKMYKKLGFDEIYCIEADIEGDGSAKAFGGDVEELVEELYEIYKRSFQFPKKDLELFKSSVEAHIKYGGEIKINNGCAVLVYKNRVTDIYSATASGAVSAAKSALTGKYSALFPPYCREELEKQGLHHRKTCIAMGRNLSHTEIYINTLFN